MPRARRRTRSNPKYSSAALIFARCALDGRHDEGIAFCCLSCFVAAIASPGSSGRVSIDTLLNEIRQLKRKLERQKRNGRAAEG
jgi:hypothetical protein